MKIYTTKFYFYGSKQPVPSEISHISSFLHNHVLGKDNNYHDAVSLYSVSPLLGGKLTSKSELSCETGAILLIRTPVIDVFKDFYLKGKNAVTKEFSKGLILKDVEYSIKQFGDIPGTITTGTSPIYLGQNADSLKREHVTYKHGNEMASKYLKRIFLWKTQKLGYNFSESDFNIEFDLNSPIKERAIPYKGSLNITTSGKIKITGTADVKSLFYGLGVGKSTGCGFGFIFNL